jgi:LacI family transcriptional regulator
MRDVAALASVSLKTVSRVVNHEAGVSGELIARVERAAEQLDYRPNLTASNLRRSDQRTATVGLLVEDVANEFFASIHRGVEEVARQRGVAVIAASLDRDPALERDLVAAFASRRVDGLILAPTAPEQGYLTTELRSGWPMVCIDRQPRGVELDAVVTDNRLGAARGVKHMLDRGHRRVAFIGGQSALITEQERFAGYVDAMAAAGAVINPAWVHHGAQDAATPWPWRAGCWRRVTPLPPSSAARTSSRWAPFGRCGRWVSSTAWPSSGSMTSAWPTFWIPPSRWSPRTRGRSATWLPT